LKEPAGLAPIIAYAKFTANVSDIIEPTWEILIGDPPVCISFGFRARTTTAIDGNFQKYFFIAEFRRDPPVHVTLTIRLTLSKYSRQWENEIKEDDSFVDDGRGFWRANVGRLLSTSSESSDESDYHFDVTLVVEGMHYFDAHRSVLACHSAVFAAMFRKSNDFKESHGREVVIDDISADTMAYMLQYLYTGDLVEKEDATEGSYISDIAKNGKIPYCDLLKASEKYFLGGLKRICEKNLVRTLTSENVSDLYILADQFSASLLKAECSRFMKGQGSRIGKSEAFGRLARQSSALFKEVCSKFW